MFTTSCSQEDMVTTGTDGAVTFEINVEDNAGSRAVGQAEQVDKLVYQVFDANGNVISALSGKLDKTSFPASVKIDLVKGQTYTVAFWAQDADCKAYTTTNLRAVTVDYTVATNNAESSDAFYAAVPVVGGATSAPKTVVLNRATAQINVGVTEKDYEAAKNIGVVIESSNVTISNVAHSLDLLTGKVGDFSEVTLAAANVPTETLSVNGVDYKYLSLSYVLVADDSENGANKALTDVNYTFTPAVGAIATQPIDFVCANIPVQRNYRTNIVGRLLTGTAEFIVSIDANFNGEFNKEDEDLTELTVGLNGKAYATIAEALAEAADGDVITLGSAEYAMPSQIALKDGAKGTITFAGLGESTVLSGCANASEVNVVMKDLKWTSPTKGYDTAFIHAQSVSFENCTLVGQYYAQSLAPHTFTNCTFDPQTGYVYTYGANCVFEGCTFNSSKGKALQVYTDSTTGESTVNINNCTFTAAQSATTGDGKPVTAIDINSFANDNGTGHKFTVNITNSTATGYGTGLYSGSSLWNIKGGEENVTVTIDGEVALPPVEVNGEYYGSIEAALKDAVAGEAVELTLAEGTYTIPAAAKGKTVTFVGTGDATETVIEVGMTNNGSGVCDGSTVTFENLTINSPYANYQGFIRMKGTYKNCIVNGQYTLYGESEFIKTTFNITGDTYNVWTYGTNSVFTDCTFNCDGKAVLVYTENNNIDDTVTFNNCTFNDNGGLVDEHKAAIETGANAATVQHTLVINGCTVNGFDVTGEKTGFGGTNLGTNVWGNKNLMTADKLDVIIDGVEVY